LGGGVVVLAVGAVFLAVVVEEDVRGDAFGARGEGGAVETAWGAVEAGGVREEEIRLAGGAVGEGGAGKARGVAGGALVG
jgi:hypothetical protein